MGVRTLPTTRAVDAVLAQGILDQNAAVGSLTMQQTALTAIDAVQGTPGQGQDLASTLGALRNAFSTLGVDPSNQTETAAVVTAAGKLSQSVNSLAQAYGVQRQGAQDAIVAGVKSINTELSAIGGLNTQIIALRAAGQSTADLEGQRDAALQSLSQVIDIKTVPAANGDLAVYTATGLVLPTQSGAASQLTTIDATTGPTVSYPAGGIPPIMLGGADVTQSLTGGSLGGNITLRDQTLPTFQAQLDEFAHGVATRFDAQGLRLFTDGAGNVPAGGGPPLQSGYIGFADSFQVNPAVVATPSLVRDGTQSVAGGATGATAFTPNPAGGPAGFATLINRVLNQTFGSEVQPGVAQPAFATSGLGPTGALSAGFSPPPDLAGFATSLVAAQSSASAAVQSDLATQTSVQTGLQTRLAQTSGVSIDNEMSTMIALQNAYGANARIISTAQALWNQLLQSIPAP
jgi:flagellar hook-associated protein 1 FlgK